MADIGVLFLGAASIERVGVDVEETGWGVVVEVFAAVASVFVTVVPLLWLLLLALDEEPTDVNAMPNALDLPTQQRA